MSRTTGWTRTGILAIALLAIGFVAGPAAASCKQDGTCYAFARYTNGVVCEAYRWPANLAHSAYVTGSHTTVDQATIRLLAEWSMNTWASACPPLPDITFYTGTTTTGSTINVLGATAFQTKYRNIPNYANALAFSSIAKVYTAQPWVIAACITDIQDRADRVFDVPGVVNSWDMQSLLTHELGHWWRLWDVSCAGATMNLNLGGNNDITARDLDQADINGVTYLYDYFVLVLGSFAATGASGRVNLVWEDADPGAGGGFSIFRSDACGGPYTFVLSVNRNDPAYTSDSWHYHASDLTVTQTKPYFYMIVDGESFDYASAMPTGLPYPSAVTTPTGLAASQVVQPDGVERVSLSWNAVPGATSGYEVYRRIGAAIGSCTDDVVHVGHAGSPSFVDATVPAGTAANYRVRARAGSDYSDYGNSVAVCVANVGNFDDTVTLCPAGDTGSAANVSIQFGDACGASWASGAPDIYALRSSQSTAGVKIWQGIVAAVTDTVRPAIVDVPSRTVVFDLTTVSGCGDLVLDVYANGSLAVGGLLWHVRSLDGSATASGSVDRFDSASSIAAFGQPGNSCWDLDWSGGSVNATDLVYFSTHFLGRHHVSRKLFAPNGGNLYSPGDVIPISWQPGIGDSARATLRLIRDTAPDTTLVVADLFDTGSYNWTIPATNRAGSTWRMQVLHSAGYYKVDYTDVGSDKSDATLTLRPNAVNDLVADAGKTTAVISWTDPIQGQITAQEHEIRYLVNAPITNANFATGVLVPAPSPYVYGTPHCVEVSGLTACRTYSFAIRTKCADTWSLISNVASASTQCSGAQMVLCLDFLQAGGGEESLRSGGDASLAGGTQLRTLLPGSSGEESFDLVRLDREPERDEGHYRVQLRGRGNAAAELTRAQLGFVDHAAGTVALPAGRAILVGRLAPATGAVASGSSSGSISIGAPDAAPVSLAAGDALLVDLGHASAQAALAIEFRSNQPWFDPASHGVLVQVEKTPGSWETVASIQPRQEFDRVATPLHGQSRARLLFQQAVIVRAVHALEDVVAVEPTALELNEATRAGGPRAESVRSGIGIARTMIAGDQALTLKFATAPVLAAGERDYFLAVDGAKHAPPTGQVAAVDAVVLDPRPGWELALGAAYPNPSFAGITIAYSLAQEGRADVRVFDVAGREVRELLAGMQDAGPHEVAWDGRDAAGRRVPAGVYFYRLTVGDWHSERKVILLQK